MRWKSLQRKTKEIAMKKTTLTLMISLICALSGWGADYISNATITTKVVNSSSPYSVKYTCKYEYRGSVVTQVLTLNGPHSFYGRIMVALMDACYEGDGKLEYSNSTQAGTWQWTNTDQSFIKVTGIVIPVHNLTNPSTAQWVEPKLKWCADGKYFDQAKKYDDTWAALRPHPTWTFVKDALAGKGEQVYMNNGWQYFNAFFKYASFSCNGYSGPDGTNRVFFKGEGFTFCFDADINLCDISTFQTATMAEAAARVMARKACCTYMNETPSVSVIPTDPDHTYSMSYSYFPNTRNDVGAIQSNWHTWDGDFTYGGYDFYYTVYSNWMTRNAKLQEYD
jgi:hypothetical protein